jgi:DNA primase catalytic core
MIKNKEEVLSTLRLRLRDYLEEHGLDTSKNFCCINPKHNDSTPSCNVLKNNPEVFYCFSCLDGKGDIFTACHFLEGKPLIGKGFFADNVMYLAKKYDVEVETTPLSEAEVYEMDTYRAYQYASDYITRTNGSKLFLDTLEEKEWDKETCAEHGVGSIDDYKQFREYLKSLGFAAGFLDDIDLSREDIFNPNSLIYTIKDEIGRPVGFSARNLLYTKDKKHGPKYKNTSVKCGIYRKSSRLYGMDSLIRNHSKKEKVFIVEGQGDVLTAIHEKITGCVGLMGSSLSPEQLYLLKDYGFHNICLMLDADEAGQTKTMDILENTLSNQRDLSVFVICLPNGDDPDEFLRREGLRAFKKLKHWTAFEWRLNQFPEETEPETICDKMVPIIANESSAVKRDKLEKTLSKYTNLLLQSIHKDVDRLLNSREVEKLHERQDILGKLKYSIDRYPDQAETAIDQAQLSLFELAKSHNEDSFSEERYVFDLQTQKVEEESKDGSFAGFLLGPDLKPMEKALCGEWKKDVWCCFGGKENTGKSAILLKTSLSLVQIPENNAMAIYHSIDDTKAQLTPRCVCLMEGNRRLTINKVRDPNWWIKSGRESEDLLQHRERGYDELITLGKSGHFVMKDANDGHSLSYIDRLIRYYKDKYPDRNLVYILDNFHKLQDFESIKGGDERVRFKIMSGLMKAMATRHHVCILSTVEYPKLQQGQIPTNENISETKKISYDANLLCHMYNDLHEWGDKAEHYHISLDGENSPVKMPRIMINYGKNKISPFKGRQWYDFYPEQSDFIYVEDSVMEEVEKQDEEKKDRYDRLIENGLTE